MGGPLQSIFLQGPIAKELKPILFNVVDPRKHTYEIFRAARVSGKRRTVPNLLIGKGFDALVFDYERVNQLDLLAANGTFLSQPMVRKAMVVIEVQIREYPRFRLFPRFRNGRFRLLATSLPLLLRTLLNR